MKHQRTCRFVPLSKKPIVLVLCQVRFSKVRKIADYIPAIQDAFRRKGFPIERVAKITQLMISDSGIQTIEQDKWEYLTKEEHWSVTVLQDSVILQTTAYETFEAFAERLELAAGIVLQHTEQNQLGIIERVGLRYINLVQPAGNEDFRTYLRQGFHGAADQVFTEGSHRIHIESVGSTRVGDLEGKMILRVVQNDEGYDLPPDLIASAPKYVSRAKRGTLVTLIDMDAFIEGNFAADSDWAAAQIYKMHDHLIETFHQHIISERALEVWK
jgi:uncharacterized protein (TIGR04255 family)